MTRSVMYVHMHADNTRTAPTELNGARTTTGSKGLHRARDLGAVPESIGLNNARNVEVVWASVLIHTPNHVKKHIARKTSGYGCALNACMYVYMETSVSIGCDLDLCLYKQTQVTSAPIRILRARDYVHICHEKTRIHRTP